MLFYNHKQEFIGIDEEGLKLLNYTSMGKLLEVCSDVSDLFANEPGYIHRFKNFGWIDFLLHADSDATSAIVHGNGRTFSCTLSVQKLFLISEPSQNGYIVEMTHIKSLSGDEIKPHIIPSPTAQKTPFVPPLEKPIPTEVSAEPFGLPDYTHLTPTPLSEPGTLDVPTFNEEDFQDETHHDLEPLEDLYTKLAHTPEAKPAEKKTELPTVSRETVQPTVQPKATESYYTQAEQAFINTLKTDKAYRFDPHIAANELGLPVDLIEEFIGDFIQQSHEFKSELFESALKGDLNNLKILSHKLKGVAANLRIQDAFETLSVVNTSNEPLEIEASLKYFYAIIAKLEGKEEALLSEKSIAQAPKPFSDETPSSPSEEPDNDIYNFSLRDDNETIKEKEFLDQSHDLFKSHDVEPLDENLFKSHDIEPLDEDLFKSRDDEPLDEDLFKSRDDEPLDEDLFKSRDDEPLDEKSFSTNEHEVLTEELHEPLAAPIPSVPEESEIVLHYDIIANAGALGLEVPFFQELLDEYKIEAVVSAEKIAGAVSAFDTHLWKRIAGELKGISDNLRLNEISEELAILSRTNDAQEAHKASKRLIGFIAKL
ncbi:MAG: hypothetical protein M0P91_01155 [Sulfuricurvum sp.]|uniref:hypothetical protein n=1 Tax=Sulfuricurvum sp. TaxID=2025608 RepID=UPI0025DBEC83|nr:hypothetical protein [Sulfuricurvum sp.]MCK9371777.1 hypothetical protein [Sulfuricurvum sp.]